MVSNAVWRQDMREGNVARKTLDDRTSGEGEREGDDAMDSGRL